MKPSNPSSRVSRRHALQQAGAVTASVVAGASLTPRARAASPGDDLGARIDQTTFIDTHEHLVEEARRTDWKPHRLLPCNDWALLFSHYLDSDLRVAGMTEADYERFFSPDTPADRKWALLEPFWPAVRHTGYGQAVRIALEKLYGVSELSPQTLPRLIERYSETVRPGFYETVLRQHAGIESCQVNSLEHTFAESAHPLLLMQDLSIIAFGAYGGRGWTWMTDSAGRKATDLAGYHRVIDH
jgi:hypothetical protein